MEWQNTICYKVNECLKEIEHITKTGHGDIGMLAKTLVKIRSDAINMENGLKANKVLRLKYNIDDEYRKLMNDETTPNGINNIGLIEEYHKEPPKFELTLKDEKGKIIYKNKIFAFIMSAVEKIEDVDTAGIMNGQTQTLAVGHEGAIWYAYDQFKQKFAGKYTEIMLKMASGVKNGFFASRQQRRRFLRSVNGKKLLEDL